MSVEKNKEVTRRTLEEVMNQSKVELIPELFAANYVHRSPGGQEIKGHDAWKQTVISAHAAFPDIHYAIDELVAEGDKVVCRYSMTATHRGEYMGIAATGKRVTSKGIFANRFENGKVAETFGVSNPLPFFQQLGVTPPTLAQTQEANKTTLRRYYQEVFGKGDLSHWSEMVDENYVMRVVGAAPLKGLEGGKQTTAQRMAMAPDTKTTIDEIAADGDIVAIRGQFTGTHTGEVQGLSPTGKKFTRQFAAFYRFKDGKIIEGWSVQDVLGMYQQLGITPPATPPGR